jgi:glycosyltransferase involved in cell wall biosynthesis
LIASTETSADGPLFTVFTPTYNRRHTLERVFDSLRAQTLRDFEWLVVDDGSTDGTPELIADWAKTAGFPIRFFRQLHSGKHIAHNLAVREARGQFFAPIDSDDALLPNTLDTVARTWNEIPVSDRPGFCGIWGLCRDQNGANVGDCYPTSPLDAHLPEVNYVLRIRGEKWPVLRTDVLRKFSFPEIPRTPFIPEAMLWLEMGKTYKIRCVNEVLRVYHVHDDRTGTTLSDRAGLKDSAPGRLCYYVWLLNNNLKYFRHSPLPFLKAAVMLPIVAWLSERPLRGVFASVDKFPARVLICIALPLSVLLYGFERMSVLGHKGDATPYSSRWPGV